MKIKDSPLCTFCKTEEESLLHLFWNCHFIKHFLGEVSSICIHEDLIFSIGDICFGNFDNIDHPINVLILNAKKYIFNCKTNEIIPDAYAFYLKFHFNLDNEYYIFKTTNRFKRWNQLQGYFK